MNDFWNRDNSIAPQNSALHALSKTLGYTCYRACIDHISTAIQDELQWLRIGERINFKLCILMHKCLNNCAPRYLADSIRPLSDDPNRSRLRSSKSADVTIPRTKTKTKMGDRAFRVAGPCTRLEQSSWIYSGNHDSSCVQKTV